MVEESGDGGEMLKGFGESSERSIIMEFGRSGMEVSS